METGRNEEQFLLLSTTFCYLMLDFCVKTKIRFSLRDKRFVEITDVEITRVDCIRIDRSEERAVLSRFKLFAIPSASFECITALKKNCSVCGNDSCLDFQDFYGIRVFRLHVLIKLSDTVSRRNTRVLQKVMSFEVDFLTEAFYQNCLYYKFLKYLFY